MNLTQHIVDECLKAERNNDTSAPERIVSDGREAELMNYCTVIVTGVE